MLKNTSIFFCGILVILFCPLWGRGHDLSAVMEKARLATVSILVKKNNKKENDLRSAIFGTGFLISSQGHVVTSAHNLSSGKDVYVKRLNQPEKLASVIGVDPLTDLAVLKLTTEDDVPFLTWGKSPAYLGQEIFIIGTPFGLEGSVSRGIVSDPNRALTNSDIGLNSAHQISGFIQTDAAMSLGHSGGPMLSLQGDVVGVNAAIVSPTEGSIGLGFAIPSRLACFIVTQLIQQGEVKRLSLGLELQSLTKSIARYFGRTSLKGALVSSIDELGEGYLNGVRAGDLILEINGEAVLSADNVPELLTLNALKPSLTLKILRKGSFLTITFNITPDMLLTQKGPHDFLTDQKEDPVLKVTELTPLERLKFNIPEHVSGFFVHSVPAGLEQLIFPASVLESVDGKNFKTSDEVNDLLQDLYKKQHPALLHLWFEGKRYFATYPG